MGSRPVGSNPDGAAARDVAYAPRPAPTRRTAVLVSLLAAVFCAVGVSILGGALGGTLAVVSPSGRFGAGILVNDIWVFWQGPPQFSTELRQPPPWHPGLNARLLPPAQRDACAADGGFWLSRTSPRTSCLIVDARAAALALWVLGVLTLCGLRAVRRAVHAGATQEPVRIS